MAWMVLLSRTFDDNIWESRMLFERFLFLQHNLPLDGAALFGEELTRLSSIEKQLP